jgi:chaperonin cofactor prefoldin
MMTLKSKVADQVADAVSTIERRVEELPDQIDDAKDALADLADRGRRLVRKNPGMVILGAFAIGFAVARLTRDA